MEKLNRSVLRSVALAAILAGGSVFGQEMTFDCLMEAAETIEVGSSSVGIVSEVMVDRGDVVERDQVLARLNSTYEAAVVEIFRMKATNTTRVEAQKARVVFVRERMNRGKILWEKNIMSSDAYDELVAELVVAESDLARELVEHRIVQLEYERSRIVLESLTIRSPIRGVVTNRVLSPGEFIHQDGYVATIAAMDPLHVEVFLPVVLFPEIKVGMIGIVEPAAPIGGHYPAAVTVVDRVFDAASGSFGVRLSLPNPKEVFPAGHRCRVTFEVPHPR